MKKTIIITGISSGIGKALSICLSKEYNVIGTIRPKRMSESPWWAKHDIEALPLDLGQKESINQFARKLAEFLNGAKVYALINNAGIVVPSAILATPAEEVDRQLGVNVSGLYMLTAKMIPHLEKGRGRIINIGSVSSRFTTPFLAPYSASKASLLCFTKSWRIELSPLGIQATQIDLGNVNTGIVDKSLPKLEKALSGIPFYAPLLPGIKADALKRQESAMKPEKAVLLIKKILETPRLKVNYLFGKDARLILLLQKLLPYRIFEQMLMARLGFNRPAIRLKSADK